MFQNFDSVETGDILLFRSTFRGGLVIQAMSHSQINHVGMAVRMNSTNNVVISGTTTSNENSENNRLFVFESNTGGKLFDFVSEKMLNGVRLVPIEHLTTDYNTIWVRKLKVTKDQDFCDSLMNFMKIYCGAPYESSIITFIGTAINVDLDTKNYSFFCSEIMAMFLYETGILDPNKKTINAPSTFFPSHFSSTFPNNKIPPEYFDSDDVLVFDKKIELPYSIIILVVVIIASYIVFYKYLSKKELKFGQKKSMT